MEDNRDPNIGGRICTTLELGDGLSTPSSAVGLRSLRT